jgi:hypothetical protein
MNSNELNVADDGRNKGSVTGTITSTSGGAYNATRIQLFRQTVKRPIPLVEDKPNDDGGYSLSYPLDPRQPMDLWSASRLTMEDLSLDPKSISALPELFALIW